MIEWLLKCCLAGRIAYFIQPVVFIQPAVISKHCVMVLTLSKQRKVNSKHRSYLEKFTHWTLHSSLATSQRPKHWWHRANKVEHISTVGQSPGKKTILLLSKRVITPLVGTRPHFYPQPFVYQDSLWNFPGFSRTKAWFQGSPSPWKCDFLIPGLSRTFQELHEACSLYLCSQPISTGSAILARIKETD